MSRQILFLLLCIAAPCGALGPDATTATLTKQIDYLQKKHEILASNIANISTPRYITQDLEKPASLSGKNNKVRVPKVRMAVTNAKHISAINGRKSAEYNAILDKTSPMKPNKNNVDLASQVNKMAINTDETSEALKNYRSSIELLGMAADAGGAK